MMRRRHTHGAGEIGARHYLALFGERLPDKKNGQHSTKIEPSHFQNNDTSTVTQNQDCGKGIHPCPPA